MAFFDTTWYVNSVGYAAVTARPQNTAVAAEIIRRQFTAPAVGSERCFVCIVAGTTANTTDATWTITRGGKTTDGTAQWQEVTGAAPMNGDITNTMSWSGMKAVGVPTVGVIIKRDNGVSYQICTTAGTLSASEPAFSNTAGVTTNDGTSVWCCIGAPASFTAGMAPHARLAAACATSWFVAGNTVYVSSNHAETQATAITIAPAGSVSTMGRILCHNAAGAYPPASGDLATGASLSTTGVVNLVFQPGTAGGFYLRGLTFKCAVGQSGAASLMLCNTGGSWVRYDNCSFELATTSATGLIIVGSSSSSGLTLLDNCTVKFAAVGQTINVRSSQFIWQNTGTVLVSGSSIPTSFITDGLSSLGVVVLEALDLSQLTGNIITTENATSMGNYIVRDCKLHVTGAVATPAGFGAFFQLARSSA